MFAKITFILIGLLLAFTASAKLWMLLTDPFADIRVGFPIPVLWIIVAFEFALASMHLQAVDQRVLALFDLAVFSALLIKAMTRWVLGYTTCGCSGSIEIPVWFFVLLDMGLVFQLIALNRRLGSFSGSFRHLVTVWKTWSPDRRGQLLGLGLFLVLVTALQLPIAAPLQAVFLGQPKIQAAVRVPDPLRAGEECIGFAEIRNLSAVPARVVGVSRSCRCFDLKEEATSIVLPPLSEISRELVIRPRKSGPLHQRIELFLDHPEQFRVHVDLIGSVQGESK